MPKKSKRLLNIILLQNYKGLGEAGKLVQVKPGFARNYLVPQNKAVYLTNQSEAHLLEIRERYLKEEEEKRLVAIQTRSAIEQASPFTIDVTSLTTKQNTLYRALPLSKIAHAINLAAETQIKEKDIELDSPIKKLGTYSVKVKCLREGIEAEAVIVLRTIIDTVS